MNKLLEQTKPIECRQNIIAVSVVNGAIAIGVVRSHCAASTIRGIQISATTDINGTEGVLPRWDKMRQSPVYLPGFSNSPSSRFTEHFCNLCVSCLRNYNGSWRKRQDLRNVIKFFVTRHCSLEQACGSELVALRVLRLQFWQFRANLCESCRRNRVNRGSLISRGIETARFCTFYLGMARHLRNKVLSIGTASKRRRVVQ